MSEKTRTFSSEETGGLDQPDGCEEGPFINRQSIQAEEPGDGLGKSEGESGQWRCGWGNSADFRGTAGPAVGSAATGAERGHLSARTRVSQRGRGRSRIFLIRVADCPASRGVQKRFFLG